MPAGEKSLTQLSREATVRQGPDETGPNMVRSIAARAVARIFSGGRQGQVKPRSGSGEKVSKVPKPAKVKAPKPPKPSNVHKPGHHTPHRQGVHPQDLKIGKPQPSPTPRQISTPNPSGHSTPLDPTNPFDRAFGYGISNANQGINVGRPQPTHQAQAARPAIREPDYTEPRVSPEETRRFIEAYHRAGREIRARPQVRRPARPAPDPMKAQREREYLETTEAQMIDASMKRGIPAPPYGPDGKPLWARDEHYADRLLAFNEQYGMQARRKGVAKALVLAMRED